MAETPHYGTRDPADHPGPSALDRYQILLPDRKEGGVPGSSGSRTETDPAKAPPPGGRLPPGRDERRFLKVNADKGKRRTLLTIQQSLGRLAMPNRDPVIATGTEGGCESRVAGAV